jgi:hypothetical protein
MSNVFVSVEDIVAADLEFDAKKRWNTPFITQEDADFFCMRELLR